MVVAERFCEMVVEVPGKMVEPRQGAGDLFTIVNAREPEDWVNEPGEDNERYAYTPPLNISGFFEDYFDGKPEAVATFWRVMNRRLSVAA